MSNIVSECVEKVKIALQTLCLPECVYEIRCLQYPKNDKWAKTMYGYFDDVPNEAEAIAADIANIDGKCHGIYMTLNPVVSDIKARCYNDIRVAPKDNLTKDKEILRRVWLPVDFDANCAKGISSNDEEHRATLERAKECQTWLREQGWPDGLLADSGNGHHLLYRIDMPNDEVSTVLVSQFLHMLEKRFPATELVKATDAVNSNAGRIWKLYGTLACKGDSIPERPHRRSSILEQPDKFDIVSVEQMQALLPATTSNKIVTTAEVKEAKTITMDSDVSEMTAFLARHNIIVNKIEPYKDGTKWVLEVCPFDETHIGGCSAIVLRQGRRGFKCHHDSCSKNNWRALTQLWKDKPTQKPMAQQLVDIAMAGSLVFQTPAQVPYITYKHKGRLETNTIKSTAVKRWLVGLVEKVPNAKAIGDAVNKLEAYAYLNDTYREVYLRVARVADSIYIDLNNKSGEVVRITKDGWALTKDCEVAFERTANMDTLPTPVAGASLTEFASLFNVADNDYWLVIGYLLDCLKGREPYLILSLNGEQGSAKTTLTKTIRRVIDAVHNAAVRRPPRTDEELALAATKNAILCYDNVSSLPQWISDALASMATGAGMAVRKLYSQDEETIYRSARPIVLNGIPDFVESPDLGDRLIKITCPVIPDTAKKDELELEEEFLAAYPRLLGALYDTVAVGLRDFAATKLERSRMALSERWIMACGIAKFEQVYKSNRLEVNADSIANSTVAATLQDWLTECKISAWCGTATNLFDILRTRVHPAVKDFPSAANKLSGQLKRLLPSLRRVGIVIELKRTDDKRLISINVMTVMTIEYGNDDKTLYVNPLVCEEKEREKKTTIGEGVTISNQSSLPSLSSLTGGEIPLDLPYSILTKETGTVAVFRNLSHEEYLQVGKTVYSKLYCVTDSQLGYKLPRKAMQVSR